MALYINKQKYFININGILYNINFIFGQPLALFSADGYALADKNGVRILAKWR